MKRSLTIGLLASILVLLALTALANQPLDSVKDRVDEALTVLKDPRYADPAQREEQRQRIWDITNSLFDFGLIAKRTIGRYHWQKSFSAQQRTVFTDLFAQFVGNNYLQRIKGTHSDIQIEYVGQEISETKPIARVKTKIIRPTGEISLDYSLRRRDGSWKVYDVFAEGVSLTQNYRTQFSKILMKETPAQLIDRLKKKIAEQEQNLAAVN